MKKILIIVIVLIISKNYGQSFKSTKMDQFLDIIAKNDKGMGSLSIFKDGKEIYNKAYGYSNLNNSMLNNSETKFRIGSISKTFTAVIIMQMIDEGKLSLQTKLSNYFPSLINSNSITIENLLHHRSGYLNITKFKDFDEWRVKKLSRKQLLNKISQQEIIFEPNEKTEYSNTNYVLLSLIAEKIDGKNFKEIIKNRIVNYCNLKNTSFGSLLTPTNNEAISYSYTDSKWIEEFETHYSIPLGAGAIISTPKDLNLFYTQLFNHKLVSKKSLKKMKTIVDGLGIGMYIFPFYEHEAFGHEGSIDGFQSVAAYFPKENLSIAICTNGNIYPTNNILANALGLYFGKDFNIPEFKKPIKLKSEDLDIYLGNYAGPEFPLKVSVSKKENQLIIKAEGQPEFIVEAYELHKFKFEQAQILFSFVIKENKLIVNQGGKDFILYKNK